MEIRDCPDFLRDADRYVLCACGCNKRFTTDRDAVILWPFRNGSMIETEVTLGRTFNKMYRAECLEIRGSSGTSSDFDSRRADLLALSMRNPAELRKLYIWMHDALRCRI